MSEMSRASLVEPRSEEVFDQGGHAADSEPMRPMTSSMQLAGTPPIEVQLAVSETPLEGAQLVEASETKCV